VFPPHAHPLAELNLVMQGTGILRIEGETHQLLPGSLIWIQPGMVHQLSDHGRDFRLHIAMMPDPGLPAPASACVHPSPESVRRLDVLFCLLRDARDAAGRDPAAKLLLHVARSALNEEDKPTIHHAGLAAALSELKRHPEASRSRLAQVARVAPATLSRLIVAGTGRTLLDLRREIRVERFLDLARNRQGTLLAHAFAAGYGSYSQCHHDCLRVTGHPPRVIVGLDGPVRTSPDAKPER
jgi:AraC-like DNA-binding protein